MFRATFLGHQGWLFAAGETHVLVDPLLHHQFGQSPKAQMQVYPPRQLDLARFPPIDAVVFTHEHEDHFNLPSINRLSRQIAIYLSAFSSLAARQVLKEMGFSVGLLHPGVALTIKDIEIVPIAPDHRSFDAHDEWDVLPAVIRDRGRDGSFFNCVDVIITKEMLKKASEIQARPGLYCTPNNSMHTASMRNFDR